MGQVPQYLITGNGRVARHMCHYFSLLQLSFSQWKRPEPVAQLQAQAAQATHILILTSDQAIEPLIREHLTHTAAVKIHFSGALVTELAYGAHPLTTFNTGLYARETYQAIPFVVDESAPAFDILLPGLPNAHVRINPAQKAKYHAMCVLAGNFSCLLWQKFFSTLEGEFGIPAQMGQAYLRQQTENLLADYASAFTGPLARGDSATIGKNLAALEGDPFQQIYQCFVDLKEKAS